MSDVPPLKVGELIHRMRRMVGHLGARDRQTVLDAIGGLEELATRLYKAEQSGPTYDVVELRSRVEHGELLSDRENDVLQNARRESQ